MNYIRHMNGFFMRMAEDQRMTSYHISLYMALFQVWNLSRFQNSFAIVREEMMQLSRIGSVNTYARCIKQLQEWGYIRYVPTSNMYVGSHVTCISFDIATDTARDTGRNAASDTTSNTATDTARDTGRNTASNTATDTATDTASNTATDTARDTGRNTATDTATDTPSYYINITNFNKQDTDKKLNNGRGKKQSGIKKIYVANDKDYSEPL